MSTFLKYVKIRVWTVLLLFWLLQQQGWQYFNWCDKQVQQLSVSQRLSWFTQKALFAKSRDPPSAALNLANILYVSRQSLQETPATQFAPSFTEKCPPSLPPQSQRFYIKENLNPKPSSLRCRHWSPWEHRSNEEARILAARVLWFRVYGSGFRV